jgi:transcriptional regulator with XRE-family HTH domain
MRREKVNDRPIVDLVVALGHELRQARVDRRWSRHDLVERMPNSFPANTLSCYENGSRECSFTRFVEICETLGVSAPGLLDRAIQRVRPVERVTVDKTALDALVAHVDGMPEQPTCDNGSKPMLDQLVRALASEHIIRSD